MKNFTPHNNSINQNQRNEIAQSVKSKSFIKLNRNLLPSAGKYYKSQGIKFSGGAEWKSALCPFHEDTNPSLRVRLDSGGFRCMVCGAHGGDIIAFHMQRYQMTFPQAARALGAWEDRV